VEGPSRPARRSRRSDLLTDRWMRLMSGACLSWSGNVADCFGRLRKEN
jgi:hypothetical protein